MIHLNSGEIGTGIHGEGKLIPIGRMDWRFLYKCGHFAPDNLVGSRSSRSGLPICILCVKTQ